MTSWVNLGSILHEQFAFDICQAFGRAVGDDDTLGRREAPIRHPQAGHEMEGHPRLEDRGIARPKAHGAFALIRWIAKADGLSSAVVFHDVVFFQHFVFFAIPLFPVFFMFLISGSLMG